MLTVMASEGPGHIHCASWGLGAELVLEEAVEGGRPGGNPRREGAEGEPATRAAEAWGPRSPSSWL